MADTMRQSSFLPTIKCSNCSAEIEIARMAEHVCVRNATADLYTNAFREPTQNLTTSPKSRMKGPPRPGRMMPPPKIDASAANRAFLPPDQLTPVSNSSDPVRAGSGRESPRPALLRSQTTSSVQTRGPPSPDLSSNLDCAFPPFPTNRSATSGQIKSKSAHKPRSGTEYTQGESDPALSPLSPKFNGGSNVLQRMNTIAPGPFDARKGKNTRTDRQGVYVRAATSSGITDHSRASSDSSRGNGERSSIAGSDRSHSSYNSNTSIDVSVNVGKITSQIRRAPPPRPPRPETVDEFIEQLQAPVDSLKQEDRSRTFPLRKNSRDAVECPTKSAGRRPSEPLVPSRTITPRPTNIALDNTDQLQDSRQNSRSPQSQAHASTQYLPLRPSSRNGRKADAQSDSQPVPLAPVLQTKLAGKSSHTPSSSESSHGSMPGSDGRSGSGLFTPATSEASSSSRRPSNPSSADEQGREKEPPGQPVKPHDATKSVSDLSDSSLRSLPLYGQAPMVNAPSTIDRQKAPQPLQPPVIAPILEGPESPMDPAIQRGLFSFAPLSEISPPSPVHQPSTQLLTPPEEAPPALKVPERPVNQRATSNKGDCRGCDNAIVGKAVKAADGRLTGRYHKQCFVCKTCRSPFQTADFYVISNNPYCERHYHQLNGSLCQSCDRGIEGQYLETDRQQKFHPHCFMCQHCRVPLTDDYFEVGGKVFCERHAFQAVEQNDRFLGPGRRHPERRTTRLMMM